MSSPILSLRHATIGYPNHPVLRQVTMDFVWGESVAIFGPNGSGKTAFLKTMAGILPLLSGQLQVHAASDLTPRRVGYVPQRATVSGVLPLTVGEVVEMGTYGNMKPWQGIGEDQRNWIDWAMTQVDITNLRNQVYASLSGGQQQRTLIARALAMNPSLLVLDEPLASLDRHSVRSMIRLLLKLKHDEGLTILWADHFVPALREVVQEVVLIENEQLTRTQIDILLDQERQ